MEEKEIFETFEAEPIDDPRRAEADKIMRDSILWASGAGLIPIPLLDIAAVTTIQRDMLKRLCATYDQNYSESEAKAFVTALVGSVGARLAADALKFIPGIGTTIGGVTMAVLSGASTYAIGKVFIKHFESGGTYLNFEPALFTDYFKEQFEKGKEYVSHLRSKKSAPRNAPPPKKEDDLYQKLARLHELFKTGVLDEKEYQALKAKLLAQL